MKTRTKGLLALLGIASLTAGTYYGVAHGVRIFYQDRMEKATAPILIAEKCTREEMLLDGTIHETISVEAHKYIVPNSLPKGMNYYEQPRETASSAR